MGRRLEKNLTTIQTEKATEGLINVSVYLTPTLFDQLKTLSVAEGIPISILARQAIKKTYRKQLKAIEEGIADAT